MSGLAELLITINKTKYCVEWKTNFSTSDLSDEGCVQNLVTPELIIIKSVYNCVRQCVNSTGLSSIIYRTHTYSTQIRGNGEKIYNIRG